METTIVNEQIIIGKQTMSYVFFFVYRLLFNFVEIMNLDVKLPLFPFLSGKLKFKYMRVSNLLSNTIRLAFFAKMLHGIVKDKKAMHIIKLMML